MQAPSSHWLPPILCLYVVPAYRKVGVEIHYKLTLELSEGGEPIIDPVYVHVAAAVTVDWTCISIIAASK